MTDITNTNRSNELREVMAANGWCAAETRGRTFQWNEQLYACFCTGLMSWTACLSTARRPSCLAQSMNPHVFSTCSSRALEKHLSATCMSAVTRNESKYRQFT